MVFRITLPTTVGPNNKIFALEALPDLKLKALNKFAECTDQFLAKLRNLFYSQQSYLQVERYVSLCLKVLAKVFEIVENEPSLLKIVHRRIFLYTVTRILPSVNSNRP